jgi:expansin (peptidoglycan-binding protein)
MLFRLFVVCCLWVSTSHAEVNLTMHHGRSSFYHAKGVGACSLDNAVGDAMVVAASRKDFRHAGLCGAYLRLIGPKGEAIVRVVDVCPGCKAGVLDINKPVFAKIADLKRGREQIRWQIISPSLASPVQYHFKKGSSRYWTGVQILNHRNPIATLEYLKADGTWENIKRSNYNYFVRKSPGLGTGPYTFRVTDWYGNSLIDKDIPLSSDKIVTGDVQFPIIESFPVSTVPVTPLATQ